MLNAAHVLEVAGLLLAAFLVGAFTGTAAKLVANRLHQPQKRIAAYPVQRVARVVAQEVVVPAAPVAPEPTAATITVAEPEPAVAVAEPAQKIVAVPEVEASALVEDRPVEAVASESEAGPDPVVAAVAEPELAPDPPAAPTPVVVEQAAPTPSDAAVTHPRRRVRAFSDEDESAAMRAIEGSWTPRGRPARASDPGSAAVAASSAAVAAATKAAQAAVGGAAAPVTVDAVIVSEDVPQAGRPAGLKSPRRGRKDNLTHVIGVLPIIETSLNSLGIFHFDQIAALSDENAAWVERHLGIEGRIRREQWREQARELAIALRSRAEVDA